MGAEYKADKTAGENIANLIRGENSGTCSGEPAGVDYPGIPSVADVCAKLGIEASDEMDEELWFAACDELGID